MTKQEHRAESRAAYNALMKFYPFEVKDLQAEEWRNIDDYEGYKVSNYGRVKSFRQGNHIILKPVLSNGYLCISLYKNNTKKLISVHRLVAKAFIPNLDNKPQINHIDGCKLNNHMSNLEWATAKENSRHAHNLGLQKGIQGTDRTDSKLTRNSVIFIRNNQNKMTNEQLAILFSVTETVISRVQRGLSYKNCKGVVRKAQRPGEYQKISENLRTKIRAEYQPNVYGHGCKALAKKYGVCHQTILNIVNEK